MSSGVAGDRPGVAFGLVRSLLGILLAIFFRSVRCAGGASVPMEGGVIFVANHVNSLLDPLLLFCSAPRPPRFLAKAPLFHHPLVAPFLRVMRALPVYRRQDEGSDAAKNRETFAACVQSLSAGEAVALFPEGKSHSEPHLQPLKTGAARISGLALAAGVPLAIVPVGLHFSARSTFRSEAVLSFGTPVPLSGLAFCRGEEPEAVRDLTCRLEEALEGVTLNAESFGDLDLVEALLPVARDALSLKRDAEGDLALRRAILDGYYSERDRRSGEIASLEAAVRSYREALRAAGLRDRDVASWAGTPGAILGALPGLALATVAYPPALYGHIFHFVPYTLSGPAAQAVCPGPDVLGTYKLYAGMFFFPLFYALQGWALAQVAGWGWACAALALAVPAGVWALRYYEFRARVLAKAWAALVLAAPKRRAKLMLLRAAVLETLKPFLAEKGIRNPLNPLAP